MNAAEARRAHRRGRARGGRALRVRRADRRAAAVRPRVVQRAPVAAAALARRRPVERAIQAGDEQTGVSIMRLVEELDAGPGLPGTGTEPIRARRRLRHARRRASPRSAGELLVRRSTSAPSRRRSPRRASPTRRRSAREERRLDPARPADELARTVRALTPHIGAWVEMPDGRAARRARSAAPATTPAWHPASSPCATRRLLLGTAEGALELVEVQPPGQAPDARRRLPARP